MSVGPLTTALAAALLLVAPAAGAPRDETAGQATAGDLAAVRALFEENLEAIRERDREAYLACYLESEDLVRTGPLGFSLGYEEVARTTGEGWPDVFEAQDLRLTRVRPGLVYGTYRYRVRYGEDEQAGLSERLFVETEAGWKIAVSTAFEAPAGTPPPPRALVGATLLDGTGAPPVRDAVVVLRDGRIECAGARERCPVPAGIGIVDLTGQWITPGLIDAHVHFSQTGWADGRPDALDVRERYPYADVVAGLEAHPERFFRSYLCSGVTAVFDVGGYPWTWDLPRLGEEDTGAPHVAAAGPLLSTIDHWVNLPGERQFLYLDDEDAAREGARYLAAAGADAAKVWLIAAAGRQMAELTALVEAAAAEARRAGLPLIVHATELTTAKAALRAGAHLLVHSVWDEPVDEEFLALAKAAGAIYCPTLTVRRGYLRMFEAAVAGRAPEIDDPNGCIDVRTREAVAATAGVRSLGATLPSGEELERRRRGSEESERLAAANLAAVHAAGIPVAMGTDAGNPLTLHGPSIYAEMEAMQAAGLSALDVLGAATRGAARAMGREQDLGTVEAGKVADLLVVAADPAVDVANLRQIRYVVRGGVLRPIAELSALARGSAEPADGR